jgi:hypothetical protein
LGSSISNPGGWILEVGLTIQDHSFIQLNRRWELENKECYLDRLLEIAANTKET